LLVGNRNALPVELTCIAALTVRFTTLAHITTATNLRPKECWRKAAPIFVIFSDLNNQENIPVLQFQILKTSWKIYSRKAK
jgi:hypothetical protein